MAKIPHRLYLTEDQMPKQWYNLRADMKEKPDPLIHPGTHQPLPEEALYPIFCQKLAHQGVGQRHPLHYSRAGARYV